MGRYNRNIKKIQNRLSNLSRNHTFVTIHL